MNKQARLEDRPISILTKMDVHSPVLKLTGRDTLLVKAGTSFGERSLTEDTPVMLPQQGLVPGADYVVALGGAPVAFRSTRSPEETDYIGGFHFAPGGNAAARAGGDEIPAINPFSLWDLNFRPACPDPRGMALVEMLGRKFWADIYLTGSNCAEDGTSKFGVTIADGNDRPLDPAGKTYKRFDYATAAAVMAAHGKGLLSVEEFFAAAFGVTEKTAIGDDPVRTGLDAPRTSKFGLMQATGNLWVWGHDGDPDTPRASLFGGYWWGGDDAGSRRADVAYNFPGNSNENFGARGRSDHLQPV
jgi:hypothetical protein